MVKRFRRQIERFAVSIKTDWMIDVIEARQNEGTNATGKRDSFYLKAQISFRHDKALTIERAL